MIPAFFGLAGLDLSADERDLFRGCTPAGYILFKRNIESPTQVRRLTDSLRDLTGNPRLPILIDQEGGRVARMRPPEWPSFPSGEAFDKLSRADAPARSDTSNAAPPVHAEAWRAIALIPIARSTISTEAV